MKTSTINNISAKKFWLNLTDNEKYACMTWSKSRAGWKRLIAFNPIDIYSFKMGFDRQEIYDFINNNKGNLIVGYVSFDYGYELYNINQNSKDELDLPDIYFLSYNNYMEFKGKQVVVHYDENDYVNKIEDINKRNIPNQNNQQISDFHAKISHSEYKENFEKIIKYIKSGDIYQVNYTHRMTAETEMQNRNLFLHFLKKNPVDHAVYLESDDFSVSSLSPERFIKIDGSDILSQPIKGTIKRGKNIEEDIENKKELVASEKEKAELFMIIDLIRNDLGKICEIGSVKVTNKRLIQKLPKVLHTYSKVKGKLNKDINSIEALLSMFPGGSITGCPKKRAMEIIDEIEPLKRGLYTGCIGYILPNGNCEFNIAIRTIVQKNKNLYLGVGGGITIDSQLENEFEETMAKAESFLKN